MFREDTGNPIPVRKIGAIVISIVALIIFFRLSTSIVENVNADQLMVIQSPISGKLTFHTTPGMKWQGFGTVTKYTRRSQYWFSNRPDQGTKEDQSIQIRFNDAGHARVSGSVAWEMPTDEAHLALIHKKYGKQESIEKQLVRTVIEKSIYMTGPLVSSKEAASEKRNDLLRFIEDQVASGVYRTETIAVKEPDAVSGVMKTVNVVRLVETGGKIERQELSPLAEFGVRTYNLSINEIKYDDTVEKQIAEQQRATMSVQTAMAEARKAEQDAITAAKHGEAEAAKAKWAQEVTKATVVTEAQQKRDVAKLEAETRLATAQLDAQAAEQYKIAQTKRGEGDAAYKRAVMNADGALAQKLATYEKVMDRFATAFEKHQGALVPTTVIGGGNGSTGNSANDFMQIMMLKAARDLSLDMSVAVARPATAVATK